MSIIDKSTGDDHDANKHRLRFDRWKNKIPAKTRYLIDLILAHLVPAILADGYIWVGKSYAGEGYTVDHNEIRLEKTDEEFIYALIFNFDKYNSPVFQIYGLKSLKAGHKHVLRGSLVKKPSQYYHSWGKPFWLPDIFWSNNSSYKEINRVLLLIGEIMVFLNNGYRGKHISKEY